MTIYCGVDFHARQQTVCFCDTTVGAVQLAELDHQADDVRGFYSRFAGEVVVGIEASGYSTWFVELLEGLGHQVLIGDAAVLRGREVGRDEWKREAGYHRRSLAETAMMRLKTLFSDRLKAREWRRQETELRVRCAAMNKMTQLGMPQSYAV